MSGIGVGYYSRSDGVLGKMVAGRKLPASEDEHSSSHSAKRARMDSEMGSDKSVAGTAERNSSNNFFQHNNFS